MPSRSHGAPLTTSADRSAHLFQRIVLAMGIGHLASSSRMRGTMRLLSLSCALFRPYTKRRRRQPSSKNTNVLYPTQAHTFGVLLCLSCHSSVDSFLLADSLLHSDFPRIMLIAHFSTRRRRRYAYNIIILSSQIRQPRNTHTHTHSRARTVLMHWEWGGRLKTKRTCRHHKIY